MKQLEYVIKIKKNDIKDVVDALCNSHSSCKNCPYYEYKAECRNHLIEDIANKKPDVLNMFGIEVVEKQIALTEEEINLLRMLKGYRVHKKTLACDIFDKDGNFIATIDNKYFPSLNKDDEITL